MSITHVSLRHIRLRIQRAVRHGVNLDNDHGMVELVETVLAIPVLLILIATIWYFGRAWYARVAVEDAAGVGARWAATSLSGAQGCRQAREAMQRTLDGYFLSTGAASMSVRPQTSWGRGQRALVSVRLTVDQSRVPVIGRALGNKLIQTDLVVPIDRNINRYAWEAC